MRTKLKIVDIDDRDKYTRKHVADVLRTIRIATGITQRDLGKTLGVDGTLLSQFETHHSWRAFTVARWARALSHRLRFELIDLPPLAETDPYIHLLDAMQPTTHLHADQIHIARTHYHLCQIRRELQLTQIEISKRWGTSPSSVRGWEQGAEGVLIPSLQRAARGYGGALNIIIEPQ